MGCKESKQGGKEESLLNNSDLSGMDRITKFEHLLPFSRTKIEILE